MSKRPAKAKLSSLEPSVKKPKKETSAKPKTYIAVILDRSGSMFSCLNQTISSFNKEIHRTIKKTADEAKSDVYVSLVTFNEHVVFNYFNQPADHVRKLTEEAYNPDGSTAMYDAVGEIIDKLKDETDWKKKDNRYIIITISDGMENASEKYTSADVAERIQTLEKRGNWVFSYLGANQDLSKISQDLKIKKGNIANYGADAVSTQRAFAASARGMARMSSVNTSGSSLASNKYYSLDDGAQVKMSKGGIRDITQEDDVKEDDEN